MTRFWTVTLSGGRTIVVSRKGSADPVYEVHVQAASGRACARTATGPSPRPAEGWGWSTGSAGRAAPCGPYPAVTTFA